MILLFAPNMRQAEWWCHYFNQPPINPRDRRTVRIVTASGDIRQLMGLRLEPEDQVVLYHTEGVHLLSRRERERWMMLMDELDLLESRSGRTFEQRKYVRAR